MEKKFSKGKWAITAIMFGAYNISAEGAFNSICLVLNQFDANQEIALSNAKLLVSAPELLEALEKIKSMCDGNKDNENDIWHIANKAIKKAIE